MSNFQQHLRQTLLRRKCWNFKRFHNFQLSSSADVSTLKWIHHYSTLDITSSKEWSGEKKGVWVKFLIKNEINSRLREREGFSWGRNESSSENYLSRRFFLFLHLVCLSNTPKRKGSRLKTFMTLSKKIKFKFWNIFIIQREMTR